MIRNMDREFGWDTVTEKDWREATAFIHEILEKRLSGPKITEQEQRLWEQAKLTRARFQDKIMANMVPSDRTRPIPASSWLTKQLMERTR